LATANEPQKVETESSAKRKEHRALERVALVLCVVAVLSVYLRSATSYGKSLDTAAATGDFHNLIADSLAHGHLSLDVTVPPRLLQLKDPYDFRANAQIVADAGIHDLSLYKGRLYAYFGPAPAILLYIPAHAFGIDPLSPTLATLIFVFVGFVLSILTMRALIQHFFGDISILFESAAALALGLAIPAPFIIWVGRGYEVSIAAGYCMTFVGLYCLALGLLTTDRPRTVLITLASLGFGLGVASRASLLPLGLLLIGSAVWVSRRKPRDLAVTAALLLPFTAVGLALAWYNAARFGSITEFGSSYQLLSANPRTYPYGHLSYVPRAIYYYFLALPRLTSHFPFLHLLKTNAGPFPSGYVHEPVVGLLTAMPVLTVGLVLGAVGFWRTRRTNFLAATVTVSILLVALAICLVPAYQIPGATMRYEMDFGPLILLASILGMGAWLSTRPTRSALMAGTTVWAAALAFSVVMNLAITSIPCAGPGSC
jgi:hypothetical protein